MYHYKEESMYRSSAAQQVQQQHQQIPMQQQQQQQPQNQQQQQYYHDPMTTNNVNNVNNLNNNNEHHFPPGSTTYEETYGDTYTGGHMVYIYPNGYQSMRPRSCPWKLSIIVCLLFTWLSIFIVGHCADQFDYDSFLENIKNNNNNENNNSTVVENDDLYTTNSSSTTSNSYSSGNANGYKIDDEAIQIRWCGSRPLYLMWVISMMITGISASYCSIIGYIKVRDFAVANSRSQPPGIQEGKSDYYLRINDNTINNNNRIQSSTMYSPQQQPPESTTSTSSSYQYYHYNNPTKNNNYNNTTGNPTIYQSDGTPQFWGTYIHKPTQAAVAVSNR